MGPKSSEILLLIEKDTESCMKAQAEFGAMCPKRRNAGSHPQREDTRRDSALEISEERGPVSP